MSDPTWDAAGTAVTGMVGEGSTWVTTYGVPAAITGLGVGLVVALLVRYGKRIRGWL